MPAVTLPTPSPATLRAFWLVASTGIGAAATAGLAIIRRNPRLLGLAVPVIAAIATPGMRDPQSVERAYRGWNRLASETGERSTRWVTRLSFEALLLTSRDGSQPTVPMRSPGTSGWISRSTQAASTYESMGMTARDETSGDAFKHYAGQPGNEWSLPLRRLVSLLRAIGTDRESDAAPPTDVYTLY